MFLPVISHETNKQTNEVTFSSMTSRSWDKRVPTSPRGAVLTPAHGNRYQTAKSIASFSWDFLCKERHVRKGYVHSWAITIIPSRKGYKLPTVYPSMLGIIVIDHECTYRRLGWVHHRGVSSPPFYLDNGMSWRKMLLHKVTFILILRSTLSINLSRSGDSFNR